MADPVGPRLYGCCKCRNQVALHDDVISKAFQDCREVLGWKYERAYEQTQKYKEGKFILEKSKIAKENW